MLEGLELQHPLKYLQVLWCVCVRVVCGVCVRSVYVCECVHDVFVYGVCGMQCMCLVYVCVLCVVYVCLCVHGVWCVWCVWCA